MRATGEGEGPELKSVANLAAGKDFKDASGAVTGLGDGNVKAAAWHGDDRAWVQVDLGRTSRVDRVNLVWGTNAGVEYRIQVSRDGSTWKDACEVNDGVPGFTTLPLEGVKGRHVRFQSVKSNGTGCDLREIEVFGAPTR